MMRLINSGLTLTAYASYAISAALAALGTLTAIIALFTGEPSAQLGGLAVIVVAGLLAATTATTLHAHRRSTR